MSTLTTKISLTKPAVSDFMSVGDLRIAGNYRVLDGACGAFSCTSGTRPASPWQSRLIFETDTGNVLFWDGTQWAYWGNKDNSRELVDHDTSVGALGVIAETLHKSMTFTATINRRYRIDVNGFGEHQSTATNGSYSYRIRWAAGASVTTAGTLLRDATFKCNSSGLTGENAADMVELDYTAATAQITVGWFVLSNDAGSVVFDGTTDNQTVTGGMMIRDWGTH